MMHLQYTVTEFVLKCKNKNLKQLDQNEIDELLDELEAIHPFSYKDLNDLDGVDNKIENTQYKNIVRMLLSCGIEEIVSYLYSAASDCNLRSHLFVEQQIPFSNNFLRMSKSEFRQSVFFNQVESKLSNDESVFSEVLNKFELKETPKFNVIDISYFINLLKSQGIE